MVEIKKDLYKSYVTKFLESNIQIVPVKLSFDGKKKVSKFPPAWTTTQFELEDFDFNTYPDLAIKTGKLNNITVIDIDDKDIIEEQLEKLGISHLDQIPNVKTKKGIHLYYEYNPEMGQTTNYYKGVDIRNDGGCAFIPCSSYIDNDNKCHKYQFHDIWSIDDFIECIKKNMNQFKIPNDYFKFKIPESIPSNIQNEINLDQFEKLKEEDKEYLDIIPADDRTDWVTVGCILKNKGYIREIWDEWSKKSNKFDRSQNIKNWNSFLKEYHCKNSLFLRAKKHNIQKAFSIKNKPYNILIEKFMRTRRENADMAQLIKELIKHIYCVHHKNHAEFIVPNEYNKWEVKENPEICRYLSYEVRQMFVDRMIMLRTKIRQSDVEVLTDNEVNNIKEEIKFIDEKICQKLGNSPQIYTNAIRDLTYDIKKFNELDEVNLNLINFENGCYDLENSCFRLPELDEMVYRSTGYDYTDVIDEEIRNEIFSMLRKIYKMENDSDELLDYILKCKASCLSGENKFEHILGLTGPGGNGKGVNDTLDKHTYGGYYGTMDSSFFTQKKLSSSSASPEIADKKGIRMMVSSECEKTDELQTALLKRLSGNDMISTRKLFKDQFEFLPQLTMFFQFNGAPNLSQVDDGIKRRFKLVDFKTSFKSNPDPNNKFEELKDSNLKNKLKDVKYRQQYMIILIEYYNKYIKNDDTGDIPLPDIVRETTKTFIYDNDIIQQYFDECKIKVTGNTKDSIKAKVLYDVYKQSGDIYEINKYGKNEFLKLIYNYNNITRVRQKDGIYIQGLKFTEIPKIQK